MQLLQLLPILHYICSPYLCDNVCRALLLRFYDPTEGDIYIDDVNLKNLSFKTLRENMYIIVTAIRVTKGIIALIIGIPLSVTTAPRKDDKERAALRHTAPT